MCHSAHAHSSQCCVWVWCSPPTPQAAAEDPTCPVFAYLCLSSPSVSQSRISHGSSLFQPCPPHLSHCIILSLPLPSPPCRNLACSQPSILTRHLKYAILFRIIYLAISTEVLLCSDPDTGGSLGAASEFEGRSAKPGMILHTRAVSWSAAESVVSEREQILSAGIQCVVLSSPAQHRDGFSSCGRGQELTEYLHTSMSGRARGTGKFCLGCLSCRNDELSHILIPFPMWIFFHSQVLVC